MTTAQVVETSVTVKNNSPSKFVEFSTQKRFKIRAFVVSARRAKHLDSTHAYILSCKHISRPIRARAYYLSYKYLLLAEFSVRTVNYGPRFFSIDLWPEREARGL